jgi:signal transduction histidine kinase
MRSTTEPGVQPEAAAAPRYALRQDVVVGSETVDMMGDAHSRYDALLRAALDVTGEHDVDQILGRMVRCSAEVAGARYAALGVYDASGGLERFIHFGVDVGTIARIGDPPQGRGLLRDVVLAEGPIRLADLTADPRAHGFPPGHPPMRTFLGVPIRVGSRRLGNLYLTERVDGREFDEDDERIIATLAAFAATAIEAALLVTAERERASAMSELAAAHERARAQRDMIVRVIDAQESERARVARDLHDQIGQSLTSVLLGLRLVEGTLPAERDDLAQVRAHTHEVRGLVVQALDEVRQLAFELRPTVLDDVGVVAALRRLADDVTQRHGVPVAFVLDGLDDDTRLPSEVETVVYRVAQEALTNVVRHAEASCAAVEVAAGTDAVRMTVTDDGVGFQVSTDAQSSLGLAGMAERASLVGGRVQISSGPTEGTVVMLEVPR